LVALGTSAHLEPALLTCRDGTYSSEHFGLALPPGIELNFEERVDGFDDPCPAAG
jgi:hypothetical protein